MPGPDPDAIHGYDDETGRIWFTYRTAAQMECNGWMGHNLGANEKRNRDARVRRIALNIRRDGWLCPHCGSEIGLHKRADARFCSYSCKKMAYAKRRKERQSDQYAHARKGIEPQKTSDVRPATTDDDGGIALGHGFDHCTGQ